MSTGSSATAGNQAFGGTVTDNTASGGIGALAVVATSGEWSLGAGLGTGGVTTAGQHL